MRILRGEPLKESNGQLGDGTGVVEGKERKQSGPWEDGERGGVGEEDKKPHLLENRIQELS